MKLKEDLMLRNIGGDKIIVPMGERLMEFNGMMRVNETGAFLWNCLTQETTKEELIEALLSEYQVTRELAKEAVENFTTLLTENHLLEENENCPIL